MATVRINIINNAVSQYTNFNFVAMRIFNGVLIGIGPTGLFKLNTGETDNSVAIDAYFIPYTVDFDVNAPKRLRRVYVAGQFSDKLNLTITGNGNTVHGPYQLEHNSGEENHVKMFSIDRGEGYKFNYADFKFENVNGSYFAIDSISAVYSIHAKRRNK